MLTQVEVGQYIDENVLHSKLWDTSEESVKQKAVNQAQHTLFRYLPDVYKVGEVIPVEDVAEQVLWLLKMDDSMQRAEMGTLMITVDGIQIQLKEMDRTISPKILNFYGISSIRRKKVGSYAVPISDTYRAGIEAKTDRHDKYSRFRRY
ncbi:hypothetical protein [Bacillus safensis]|uniref:Uncharacterized protein n=1 Tax=Bacillus safensis TaxID=561879 RepID=A0A1L6ZJ88_BACIA|nr:hypothetical protein [Bacillus safensis]APT46580.1 hypothetical protein BSA145_12410 [Bacillus safensis]